MTLAALHARTDPIEGGSSNDYDYAAQDPINNYDLDLSHTDRE
jgi:hypothetical protein